MNEPLFTLHRQSGESRRYLVSPVAAPKDDPRSSGYGLTDLPAPEVRLARR